MKKQLKTGAALLAALMVSTLGLQACSEDNPFGLSLGAIDEPTAGELLAAANAACTGFCDGDIGAIVMSAGKIPSQGTYDDDYDALMETLSFLLFDVEPDADTAAQDLLAELYPDTLPEGEFNFGPVVATVNLDETCGDGTGALFITRSYLLQETPPMAGKALYGGPFDEGIDELERDDRYVLALSNCEITGDITGGGNETVVLSGTLTFHGVFEDGDSTFESLEFAGNLTVNPGAVEPAGDPVTIWGYDETLTIDVLATDALMANPPLDDGGTCYGGTDASSEMACDGLFMDNDDSFWNLLDARIEH